MGNISSDRKKEGSVIIYVLEGADGTGKSTLAEKLAKKVHAMVIHAYYDPQWDMKEYHTAIIRFAEDLDTSGINVILDRWCLSEQVYGTVFRGGPAYKVEDMIIGYGTGLKWIYCRNDNAAKNHKKNMKKRTEMFDDMTRVQELFDQYVEGTPQLGWHTFDFDKTDTDKFLNEVTS